MPLSHGTARTFTRIALSVGPEPCIEFEGEFTLADIKPTITEWMQIVGHGLKLDQAAIDSLVATAKQNLDKLEADNARANPGTVGNAG